MTRFRIIGRWIGLLTICMAVFLAVADWAVAAEAASGPAIQLPVRWQTRDDASGPFAEKSGERNWKSGETALVICDVWDRHWCQSASRRCDALARQMAPLVAAARARGILIVHAPSDSVDFYRDAPARQRAAKIAIVTPPSPIGSWCPLDKGREGELPIDDSDGGCDCQPQCRNYKAWSRQHPAIAIEDVDLVSDDGKVIYSYFVAQGVKNVIYIGVHTNMCVLGRSFGIRQMNKLGFNEVLVRDLTDTMYNPRKRPFVEHAAGTDLMIKHVEQHWCPTMLSAALAEGLR